MTTLQGEWAGFTAGGSINNPSTFGRNPQFLLHVSQRTTCTLTLSQHGSYYGIGFFVCRKNGKRATFIKANELVGKADYMQIATVSASLDLVPEPAGYTVIVSTFSPGEATTFTVTVEGAIESFTNMPAFQDPKELFAHSVSQQGSWEGDSAGGCHNHVTVVNNPQFSLQVTERTSFLLQLAQEPLSPGSPLVVLGLSVAHVNTKGGRVTQLSITKDDLSASFVNAVETTLEGTLDPLDFPYTVLPSTFNPGETAHFSLTIYTDKPVTLVPLKEEKREDAYQHKLSIAGAWRGETAGGCLNFPTAVSNPQYALLVKQPMDVLVVLEQINSGGERSVYIGCSLANKRGQRVQYVLKNEMVTTSDFFTSASECTMKAHMEPLPHPYTIFVSTFDPGEESSFNLTVYSSAPEGSMSLEPLPSFVEPKHEFPNFKHVKGEWRGASAGGCVLLRTVVNNPQYHVLVSQRTKLYISLKQIGSKYPINISLADTKGSAVSYTTPDGAFVSSSGTFVELSEVHTTDIFLEPRDKPYTLLPSTFHAGLEGAFELTVMSDLPVSVVPIEQEVADFADLEESDDDESTHTSVAKFDTAADIEARNRLTIAGMSQAATKREYALLELLSSEESYVRSLQQLSERVILRLRELASQQDPILSDKEIAGIFGCVENVLIFNRDMFLTALRERYRSSNLNDVPLSDIFEKYLRPMRKFYSTYVSHYEDLLNEFSRCLQSNARFKEFCNSMREQHMEISSFLIMPVQRVPRYELLIREILKTTDASTYADYQALQEVFKKVEEVSGGINVAIATAESAKKLFEIQNRMTGPCLNIGAPGRVFLLEQQCQVIRNKKKKKSVLFLFSDILMFCKTKNGRDLESMDMKAIARAKVRDASVEYGPGDWIVEFHDGTFWTIFMEERDRRKWEDAVAKCASETRDTMEDLADKDATSSSKRGTIASAPMKGPLADVRSSLLIRPGSMPGASMCSGWLVKHGGSGLMANWKRRWFVLDGTTVSYCAKDDAKEVKGVFDIRGYYAKVDEERGVKHKKPHLILEKDGERTYYLRADSNMDRDAWIERLNAAAQIE